MTTTTPAAPFTSTGRRAADGIANVIARLATADAPSTNAVAATLTRPPSERSTTSGCRMSTRAAKSPSREAAKNASTTSRCRREFDVRNRGPLCPALGGARGSQAAPCCRR